MKNVETKIQFENYVAYPIEYENSILYLSTVKKTYFNSINSLYNVRIFEQWTECDVDTSYSE